MYLDNPIVPGRALDILLPDAVTQPHALFFVHGGGWRAGSRSNYHVISRAYNREGFICASTDYRLSLPEVNIFDQLTDIRHSYALFTQFLKKQGLQAKVVVHGTSAGAHVAALLALAKPGQCGEAVTFRDMTIEDWVPPAAAALQATPVLFEPWEDIFPRAWEDMQLAAGARYEKDPERFRRLAPMNYISRESCPVFFMEAECEEMFPLRYIKQFIAKMHSLGRRAEYKIYTNAEHGFFYDLTRRQQKEAFADLLAFARSLRLKPGTRTAKRKGGR